MENALKVNDPGKPDFDFEKKIERAPDGTFDGKAEIFFRDINKQYGKRAPVITIPLSRLPTMGMAVFDDRFLDFGQEPISGYIRLIRMLELLAMSISMFWLFWKIIRSFEF